MTSYSTYVAPSKPAVSDDLPPGETRRRWARATPNPTLSPHTAPSSTILRTPTKFPNFPPPFPSLFPLGLVDRKSVV